MVTAAHARGIRIIIDLPFSATSKKHPFFQDCLTNKAASPYAGFYIWSGAPGESEYFYLYDWNYLPSLKNHQTRCFPPRGRAGKAGSGFV